MHATPEPQGMIVLRDRFLDHLKVRNYSTTTIDSRRKYLTYFIAWAEQRGLLRPAEVTRPAVERYQRFLYHYRKADGKPLSFRSQFHHLAVVRVWFKWLARNNHVLYNPAAELELPRLGKRLPRFILTPAEVELVLTLPDVNEPLGLRDRAILETFYSTGIRRMELAALAVYDVDVERGVVMVRQGKGKKDRMACIGDRALAWIDRYVHEVRPRLLVGDQAGDTLFLTHSGLPFPLNGLSDLVHRYVEQAQLGKQGGCHLFRHSMATAMHENGADIRFIQVMLGHATIESTAIYTQVAIKKLKDIHTAMHPAKLNPSKPDEPPGPAVP